MNCVIFTGLLETPLTRMYIDHCLKYSAALSFSSIWGLFSYLSQKMVDSPVSYSVTLFFFSCFCYFNDVSLVILDDETVHDNILLIFVFHKQ